MPLYSFVFEFSFRKHMNHACFVLFQQKRPEIRYHFSAGTDYIRICGSKNWNVTQFVQMNFLSPIWSHTSQKMPSDIIHAIKVFNFRIAFHHVCMLWSVENHKLKIELVINHNHLWIEFFFAQTKMDVARNLTSQYIMFCSIKLKF